MTQYQYRIRLDKPEGEKVYTPWQPTPITKEEMADWREQFICPAYAERRQILYGWPEEFEPAPPEEDNG